MRFTAKLFGYTDISRDPYGILPSAPPFEIMVEHRYYATTVYIISMKKT
jgi:hypothetical protein